MSADHDITRGHGQRAGGRGIATKQQNSNLRVSVVHQFDRIPTSRVISAANHATALNPASTRKARRIPATNAKAVPSPDVDAMAPSSGSNPRLTMTDATMVVVTAMPPTVATFRTRFRNALTIP